MRTRRYAILYAVVALLAVYTFSMRYRDIEEPPPPDLSLVPEVIAGYRGSDNFLEPASLAVLGADATLFRTFMRDEEPPIWLFLGYFGAQQERSQIHSPKNCYPGAGWNILREEAIAVTIPNGEIPAKRLLISDGVQRRIVIYWFSTPTGPVMDEFALKWYQAKRSLFGQPQVSTFVRFSTVVQESIGIGSAEKGIIEFIGSAAPTIEEALSAQSEKRTR